MSPKVKVHLQFFGLMVLAGFFARVTADLIRGLS